MADNIGVKPNTSSAAVSVATDNVNGIHYPVYKFAIGPDGSATLIDSDNPIPVESTDLIDLLREIRDVNKEILKQMKTINAFYREWDGDQLEE